MTESMAQIVTRIESRTELDLAQGSVRIGAAHCRQSERRDLVRDLGTLIYTHLHVGHHVDDGLDPAAGRDLAYETWLGQTLSDRSIRRRMVLLELDDDEAVIDYLGLRVSVPRARVEVTEGPPALAELDFPLLSPALSPGFALARGPYSPPSDEPLLRVYCAASNRDAATEMFLAILDVLRTHRRWHAKVASQARLYPRSDAVTVYLHRDELNAVPSIVAAIDQRFDATAPEQSAFTRSLTPTVSCAWEPTQRSVSFGQHRARVAAQLVLARAEGTWCAGDTELACRRRDIDPIRVWRNVTSPDPELLRRPVQAAPVPLSGVNR